MENKFPVFYKYEEDAERYPAKLILWRSPVPLLAFANFLTSLYLVLFQLTTQDYTFNLLFDNIKASFYDTFWIVSKNPPSIDRPMVLLDVAMVAYLIFSVNTVVRVAAGYLLQAQQTEENIKEQSRLLKDMESISQLKQKIKEIEEKERQLEERNITRQKEKQPLFVRRKVMVSVFPVDESLTQVFVILFVCLVLGIALGVQLMDGAQPNILKAFAVGVSMAYLIVLLVILKVSGGSAMKDNRFRSVERVKVVADTVQYAALTAGLLLIAQARRSCQLG